MLLFFCCNNPKRSDCRIITTCFLLVFENELAMNEVAGYRLLVAGMQNRETSVVQMTRIPYPASRIPHPVAGALVIRILYRRPVIFLPRVVLKFECRQIRAVLPVALQFILINSLAGFV